MTGLSLVIVTLLMVGVFALFWWLVELTGGVAGGALSICRSMQTGFVSWHEARGRTPVQASPTRELAIDSSEAAFDVPTEIVRGRAPRRRF